MSSQTSTNPSQSCATRFTICFSWRRCSGDRLYVSRSPNGTSTSLLPVHQTRIAILPRAALVYDLLPQRRNREHGKEYLYLHVIIVEGIPQPDRHSHRHAMATWVLLDHPGIKIHFSGEDDGISHREASDLDRLVEIVRSNPA
jgi:hypothetical protein